MLFVPFPDRSFMVATEYELPPFDLRRAMDTLAAKDPLLAPLIKETREFRVEKGAAESPYEVLVEAITHQSISGKAAATVFGRVKALGSNGRIPAPHEMLKLGKRALRKARPYKTKPRMPRNGFGKARPVPAKRSSRRSL